TTIQDTFYANSELLARHGLVYPRIAQIAGHHGLVYDWVRLPKTYAYAGGSLANLSRLAEAHAGGDATLFLSSEEFSRIDPQARVDFAQVRERLAAFDEIEVICVLRQQWQFLQSVYLELGKKRVPPRPPQFVQPVIEKGTVAGLAADYNLLLDRLETVFAPEEITFVDFHAARAARGGILGWMLDHLRIDLDPGALEKVNGGSSNVSPMSLASWAANMLAEPQVAPPWLVDEVTKLLRREHGDEVSPCLFTRAEFQTLKMHFDARNGHLAARRAAAQPGFSLKPADEDRLDLFRNDLGGQFWLKVARRVTARTLKV
ncbi:hypothetical protein, partial [Roseivivax isoporae]